MLSLDPKILIFLIPLLIFSLIFHEYLHAVTAVVLGDNTPRQDKRLTFNPMAHLDLVGSLALLFIGFGWAKPVRINPQNLKHPLRDDIFISIAGPFANFFLALIALLFIKYIHFSSEVIYNVLWFTYQINLVLAVFNALPFYPLDGSHVVASILQLFGKPEIARIYQKFSGYAFLILIALDLATDISIFRGLIVTVSNYFEKLAGI